LSAGLTKATDTHWEYVIISAFSRQKCLQERASNLHTVDTYIACPVRTLYDGEERRKTILFIVNKSKIFL